MAKSANLVIVPPLQKTMEESTEIRQPVKTTMEMAMGTIAPGGMIVTMPIAPFFPVRWKFVKTI